MKSAAGSTLPLAAAQRRLGKPGRPRKAGSAGASQASAPAQRPDVPRGSAATVPEMCPSRLLDLPSTATYLAVSPWTVRDLEAAGVLRRVRIPLPNGGEVRRLLFDKSDLDALIQGWKDGR